MSPFGGEGGGGYVPSEHQRAPEPDPAPEKHEGPAASVPESEMQFTFSASGGPGGQNVNKVASKATLRWNVGKSGAYSEEQKQLIRDYSGSYLNKADEIIIQANEQRSQHQNRESATERLQNLVAQALVPKKERKATKPSWGKKQQRLDEKRMEGNKKRERRKGGDDY